LSKEGEAMETIQEIKAILKENEKLLLLLDQQLTPPQLPKCTVISAQTSYPSPSPPKNPENEKLLEFMRKK